MFPFYNKKENPKTRAPHRLDSFYHRSDSLKKPSILSERQIIYPYLVISMRAEFPRLVSSYIIVKTLKKGDWVEICKTEPAARSFSPSFRQICTVTCTASHYTKQKLRFDIYDDDIHGTWNGYLLGRVEIPLIEVVKQSRFPIMRGDDILGYLIISLKLDVITQTIKMNDCDLESFGEIYPDDQSIRNRHPSYPYELKTYDLSFSATDLCPNDEKVLDNGYLTLEILAGEADFSEKAGDLRRIWVSNPIRFPYNLKKAAVKKINRATLLGLDSYQSGHRTREDDLKKRLVFHVRHIQKGLFENSDSINGRVSTLKSYCSVSVMKILRAVESDARVVDTVIERNFVSLAPHVSGRDSRYRRLSYVDSSVLQAAGGTAMAPKIIENKRSVRLNLRYTIFKIRDKVRKKRDKLLGKKLSESVEEADVSEDAEERKRLTAKMPLDELLLMLSNYPTSTEDTALSIDDVNSVSSSVSLNLSDVNQGGRGSTGLGGQLDTGEVPAEERHSSHHRPSLAFVLGSDMLADISQPKSKFGRLVLTLTKHTEINDVYPGEDSYERELKKTVKRERDRWRRAVYPTFDLACEEEADVAMKAVAILDGMNRGWRLKSCILVDLNDLCIRNLKNKAAQKQDGIQVIVPTEESNVYGVVESIYNLTSHFCTENKVYAYAGGGVRPPSKDHPAAGYCRYIGFPLVQGDDVITAMAASDDENDVSDDDSDGNMTMNLKQVKAEEDEVDLLEMIPAPDVDQLDPSGQLRTLLHDKSMNGWGGWSYGRTTGYRSQSSLKQGLLEAASVYSPCPLTLSESLQHANQPDKVMRFSFVGRDVSLRKIFARRSTTSTTSDESVNFDVETLAKLLLPPEDPKEVRIVSWVLGRCPPEAVLLKAEVILRHMSEKAGGPVALLVVLAAESGTHKQYFDGWGDAYPFEAFFNMFQRVMENPRRALLREDESLVDNEDDCDPSRSKIRYWRQQNVEKHVGSRFVEYHAVVACPRLLVYHELTWNEVMNKALCEDAHVNGAVALPSHESRTLPTTGMIVQQCSHIFKKITLDKIQADLDPKKSPDYMQVRELRRRFEDKMKVHASRRLNLFVHEVLRGAMSGSEDAAASDVPAPVKTKLSTRLGALQS